MKRNALSTAVLAGLTGLAGMASVSHAVNVNPDGLGQVLLFPYYTAREGNNTLISIVNTRNETKAVKVRFIEALNSREVLDFNLYLSPYDVWTAAIVPDAGGGAKMITTDTSCTVPYFQGGTPGEVGEQAFLNFQYTGDFNDRGPQGLERTKSGYIEIIEMGNVVDIDGFPAASAAKHVNGVPRSGGAFGAPCSILNEAWAAGPWGFGFGIPGEPDTAMEPVSGGVFGGASIVNVREGTMLTYNAVALDAFWARGTIDHTDPGSVFPNLRDGDTISNVFLRDNLGNVFVDTQEWPTGGEAVNATLMYDQLFNEYSVRSDLLGRTEWVVTFPTKRFHTDDAPGGFRPILDPLPPFTNTWRSSGAPNWSAGFACEVIRTRIWDREEREPATGIIVSPPPPVTGFQLCREANVIRFSRDGSRPAATEIMGEPERDTFPTLTYTNFQVPTGFQEGWLRFDFSQGPDALRTSRPAVDTGARYVGLPVVGFSATTITNGVLPGGTLSNYGGTFQHRGSRRVVTGTQS